MYNIVLFHLESVNQVALIKNKQCFPNLDRLMNSCVKFENYFSTATSTYMVMADVTYEDVTCYEKSKELENIFHISSVSQSVWDELAQMGYNTKIYINGYDEDDEIDEMAHFLLSNGNYMALDDNDMFASEFENFVFDNNKFVTYILENVSHIAYSGKRVSKGLNAQEGYTARYKAIDRVVGIVLNALENSKHLEDTIIMMYGDHGDSVWAHGLHGGYLHAIPPYHEMIHCPFVCRIPGENSRSDYSLICTKDIRKMLLKYAQGNLEQEWPERKYIFSRNLYVNQPLKKYSFEKSYGVNNLRYTLIVTRKGLEMYMNNIDFSNQTNILEFFKLRKGRLIFNKVYKGIGSGHFKALMNSITINDIIKEFEFLYMQLVKEVSALYHFSCRNISELKLNKIYYAKITYAERIKLIGNSLLILAVHWHEKIKGNNK